MGHLSKNNIIIHKCRIIRCVPTRLLLLTRNNHSRQRRRRNVHHVNDLFILAPSATSPLTTSPKQNTAGATACYPLSHILIYRPSTTRYHLLSCIVLYFISLIVTVIMSYNIIVINHIPAVTHFHS